MKEWNNPTTLLVCHGENDTGVSVFDLQNVVVGEEAPEQPVDYQTANKLSPHRRQD